METNRFAVMAKRWYIVHAYSNFERKVADSIREQAKSRGLAQLFEEVMVPTEKVVEVRRGRKVDAERKFFPGYVLVKVDLTDEAYHLIKNTPKVTGFLGADKKPMPISDAEAARILHQVQEGIERPKPSITFEVGEQVRVSDGPANPSPPIGPALGQRGLNIMEFCKAFNAQTQNLERNAPIPVVITIYADRSFNFEMRTPPVSYFLKKAAKIESGSKTPGR